VFFTREITPAGLQAVYDALGWSPTGKVAVKLSTGEAGNTHYLSPDLIKDLVKQVDGVIVESNTAYPGARRHTDKHRKLAADHGFTAIAEVDILDAEGELELPVTGGEVLEVNRVGSHFANYDSYLVLSHFKGHVMGGFGGALKNISIGIASSKGKMWIHGAGVAPKWSKDQDGFLRAMAEAAKSVIDHLEQPMAYVNVMNFLSVDCDCDGHPKKPDMADIGILASLDPVALDQACIDLVWAADDGANVKKRVLSRNGLLILEHAAKLGLGSRTYRLVSL
jgi:uncharacterized Fe-S center protein